MKKPRPVRLPDSFPLHAPLPPGGPWIRPSVEDDRDEVTVALQPDAPSPAQHHAPDSGLRPTARPPSAGAPESGLRPTARPPSSRAAVSRPPSLLGLGIVPSLTPLAMVEADARVRKRSA